MKTNALIGFHKKAKTEGSKNTQEKKPNKPDLDTVIQDTKVKLVELRKRYESNLKMELSQARANKEIGKKDASNYSRIGIYYYSLHIIEAAREKLADISSSRELYVSMNELGMALNTINGIRKKTGKVSADAISSGMKKLAGKSSSESGSLIAALEKLSGLDTTLKDAPVDTLVSLDVIERLINEGPDLREMAERGEGIQTTADETLGVFEEILGNDEELSGIIDNLEDVDLEELLNSL